MTVFSNGDGRIFSFGKLMVIGAAFDPIDAEDILRFAQLTGVRPMIETYPLEKAAEAYARMLSGDAQFRVVLTM
jgi:D-arabinose 1-dehydrogenase-like Zn-dependent alcohol dehydrogenase